MAHTLHALKLSFMHMHTDLMNSLLVLQCTELMALSQRLGESLSIAIKEYVNHTDIICDGIRIHMCSVLYVEGM